MTDQHEALLQSVEFAEEALVVDIQSMLEAVMEAKGFSRAQLADAMGVSRPRVTQMFSDDCKNFTVRLLARALYALNEEGRVTCPSFDGINQIRKSAKVLSAIQQSSNVQRHPCWNVSAFKTNSKARRPSNEDAEISECDQEHVGALIERAMHSAIGKEAAA